MDLRDLTTRLVEDGLGMWRFRWAAVAVAWVVALVGWVVILTLPNDYEATARVYVNAETTLKPLLRELTVSTDTLSDVGMVTQALLSQPQLKAVASATGLESRASNPKELEQLLDGIKLRTTIARLPNQDIFRISFRDHDPEMARNVVQVLLNNFMQNSLRKDRTDTVQAQSFLQSQIKLYEKRLEQAEEALADFKKKNVGLMPGEGGDYYNRLQTAQQDLNLVQAEYRAIESRRDELKRQVEGETPVLGIGSGLGSMAGTTVDGPIADLEKQLADLRVKFTDKHPDVIRVRQTLDDLYKIRDEERRKASKAARSSGGSLDVNPVYQQMRVALSTAEAELAASKAKLAEKQQAVGYLKRMVDTIPEVEAQLNRLNRDYAVVKKQYDGLVQSLESARLSEEVQAGNEQVTFDVIEPPRLPLIPVAPNRPILLAVVILLALGCGGIVSYFLNQHNPVYFSGQSLRAATGLPVFATVGLVGSTPISRNDKLLAVAASLLLVTFILLLLLGGGGLPGLA